MLVVYIAKPVSSNNNLQRIPRWLDLLFIDSTINLTDHIETADVVIFPNGPNLHPSTYLQNFQPEYFTDINLDKEQLRLYSCVKNHQVCIGIGRGALLGCVVNGGTIIPYVSSHYISGNHSVYMCQIDSTFKLPSLHKSMMYPYNNAQQDITIYGVMQKSRSMYDGPNVTTEMMKILMERGEPEIVEFHCPNRPRFLAIQPPLEFIDENSESLDYLRCIVKRFIQSTRDLKWIEII